MQSRIDRVTFKFYLTRRRLLHRLLGDTLAEYKAESHRRYDKHKRDQGAKKFYNSKAWQVCRSIALARDNYLCQECLKQGRLLHIMLCITLNQGKNIPNLHWMWTTSSACVTSAITNHIQKKGKGKKTKSRQNEK